MRTMLVVAIALLLFPAVAYAQGLEPQVRILAHSHFFDGTNRAGVATWSILPDVTEQNFGKDNPTRLLAVLGPAFKFNIKTIGEYNWLEVMAGALVEVDRHSKITAIHPVLNIRVYLKWRGKNDLYLENLTRQDRLLFAAFATTPLAIGGRVRLGAESEAVIPLDDKIQASFSLGPRLSIKLPCSCLLATVLFINQDARLVWRTYVKLGK